MENGLRLVVRLISGYCVYAFLIALMACNAFAQKPNLDLESYKSWPSVGIGGLSKNGRYAFYSVDNIPLGGQTVNIMDTKGKMLTAVSGLRQCQFSKDSRYLFGMLEGGILMKYDLGRRLKTTYAQVDRFELKVIGEAERIITLSPKKTLMVNNLEGRLIFSADEVKQFVLGSSGRAMAIQLANVDGDRLVWVDGKTFAKRQLYQGLSIDNIIFDSAEQQLCFMVNQDERNSIYYYRLGRSKAEPLIVSGSENIDTNLVIEAGSNWRFSQDGTRVFFGLKEKKNGRIKPFNPDFEIWSYQDAVLGSYWYGPDGKSGQIAPREYLSWVSVKDGKFVQLLKGDDTIVDGTFSPGTDSILVVASRFGDMGENWNQAVKSNFEVLFTKTGLRVPIEEQANRHIGGFNVSPTGKYIAYFDPLKEQYKCYDVSERKCRLVGADVTDSFIFYTRAHFPTPGLKGNTLTGWLPGDSALVLNGSYDLWSLDPKGKKKSSNLTLGIGKKDNVVFSLVGEKLGSLIGEYGKLILSGIKTRDKNVGFYELSLRSKPLIKRLSESNHYYFGLKDVYARIQAPFFLGTKDSGYLVRREKYNQAPNYFYTKDLITFSALSELSPQRKYNWIKAELHTYTDKHGDTLQGVLYKPENFDPLLKYPLVFNVYETKSSLLNAFQSPDPVGADVNIPYLVSNGYLVFLPDVKGEIKKPGEAAVNSIEAAVRHLSGVSFVDTANMAITGHSYGGFEVNYILSRLHCFKAAIVSAGVSNWTYDGTGTWADGSSRETYMLNDLPIMQETFGVDPGAYVANSPIMKAREVTTPVLFMHNDGDTNVLPEHTKGLFIVLRSLGKPCWWVNYRGERHAITGEKNRLDFARRTFSFLEYYLKGKPMPGWMKEHI